MPTDPVVVELAALAHRFWCEKMRSEGWRHGSKYNERSKLHDALVPFERLSAHDRRAACLIVAAEGLGARLAGAISYGRGPDRELTAEEMRPGLHVRWAAGFEPEDDPEPEEQTGVVDSWVIDQASGLLSLVRVKWDDGDVSEHYPAERELRRLDDRPT